MKVVRLVEFEYFMYTFELPMSTYVSEDRSTFCKLESSHTKVRYLITHALSWNGKHTLSVYMPVEWGERACVQLRVLSLAAVECNSSVDNFLCEVVSSSLTGSHVGGFTHPIQGEFWQRLILTLEVQIACV